MACRRLLSSSCAFSGPAKLIARDEAAIGERSEATDFSVNFKSREFSADFQVPEPDGLVIGAQGELSVRG